MAKNVLILVVLMLTYCGMNEDCPNIDQESINEEVIPGEYDGWWCYKSVNPECSWSFFDTCVLISGDLAVIIWGGVAYDEELRHIRLDMDVTVASLGDSALHIEYGNPYCCEEETRCCFILESVREDEVISRWY